MRADLPLIIGMTLMVIGALAQGAQGSASPVVTLEESAPPDGGAAGKGSMGTGTGIGRLPPSNERNEAFDGSLTRPLAPADRNAGEPGHGGNETDMVHHRRPQREKSKQ
ncbi:hypothetical protein N8H22_09765 [Stutzerimonas stutzeri]|uniref:hypothetical protein n=1 Tax=Stutzerimonas sp. S1 TaxID=3030652 RepID=UPI002224EE83|nr:hypothetical protein [Stutzerimonas sp. S1]MCW3148879.1 hypothetical protein [Stutzerimonas sp. S1]